MLLKIGFFRNSMLKSSLFLNSPNILKSAYIIILFIPEYSNKITHVFLLIESKGK